MHLPDDISLVWHGINDVENLHHFLSSPVQWGECDVRRDPSGELVLRHDPFSSRRPAGDEPPLSLEDALAALAAAGRSVKLDLKEGANLLPDVTIQLEALGIPDDRVWFNASIEVLAADGFRALRSSFPGAIVQCPVDWLTPLVMVMPLQAREVLSVLTRWGIDRVSVAWWTSGLPDVLRRLQAWGCAVNLYGVPDLDAFLRAARLRPESLTADFNFPEWGFHGHGSGAAPRADVGRTEAAA
jgi:hypothetical protein